jgi:putative transposase
VKYAWIERHRQHWPVSLACEVLGVSPSGYHDHKVRAAKPRRNLSDDALLVHIRAVHAESRGEYGWPRVWKELLANGIRVGKERVRKLMSLHGIKARGKRKFKATTDSNHKLPVAENLLNREFNPPAPDSVWASDITYVATDEGWLYLAVIIDLFSRQVVGWSMKPHMKRDLVIDALHMAWFRRQPAAGLIFHSDRSWKFDEPQRQLLGQRTHREPVGIAEGRPSARASVRHTARRDGRDRRLARLLQPPTNSLVAGLRQPDAVREGMACRPT